MGKCVCGCVRELEWVSLPCHAVCHTPTVQHADRVRCQISTPLPLPPPQLWQVSFLEGASGLLACRAVLAHLEGDAAALDTHIQVGGCCSLSRVPAGPPVACFHHTTPRLLALARGASLTCCTCLLPVDPDSPRLTHWAGRPAVHTCCPPLLTAAPLTAAACCPQELVGLWDSRICGVLPDGECELLYGRAGYLYSLTWLQQQLGRDTVPDSLIKVRTERGGGGRLVLTKDWVCLC